MQSFQNLEGIRIHLKLKTLEHIFIYCLQLSSLSNLLCYDFLIMYLPHLSQEGKFKIVTSPHYLVRELYLKNTKSEKYNCDLVCKTFVKLFIFLFSTTIPIKQMCVAECTVCLQS